MSLKKIKILYVEDELSLARIVSESLSSRNFEVFHVKDGHRALKIYEEAQPDLCVLDIMLPGKDGYTIAEEIKQGRNDVPILFLSAKVQTKDVIQGFKSGGNDYLKKPFSMEELIVRINNLINLTSNGKRNTGEVDRFELGGYIFLPRKFELYRDGKLFLLSHRESKLLELLCSFQNDTCPRKKILMELWGDDSYFNSRTLDVYINKLRNYFKKEPNINIITLKGVGYLFKVETGSNQNL